MFLQVVLVAIVIAVIRHRSSIKGPLGLDFNAAYLGAIAVRFFVSVRRVLGQGGKNIICRRKAGEHGIEIGARFGQGSVYGLYIVGSHALLPDGAHCGLSAVVFRDVTRENPTAIVIKH